MIGIELVRDQATKERAPELRDRLVDVLRARRAGAGRRPEFDPHRRRW